MKKNEISLCLVDDELIILESFAEHLKSDYAIQTFESAKAALKELEAGYRPHVIITDLRMPEMDGFEFIKELRNRRIESSVLVISGHADKSDVIKAANFGISGFIEKPFSMRQLREVIYSVAKLPPTPTISLDLLRALRDLVQGLESMSDSSDDAKALAENYLAKISDALYDSPLQKKHFLAIVQEQKLLGEKISIAKKMIRTKISPES